MVKTISLVIAPYPYDSMITIGEFKVGSIKQEKGFRRNFLRINSLNEFLKIVKFLKGSVINVQADVIGDAYHSVKVDMTTKALNQLFKA